VEFDSSSKKFKVLARMVEKVGSSFKEVDLVENGTWSTKCVFTIRHMCDISSVESCLGVESVAQW
jgi:hypothetical protein